MKDDDEESKISQERHREPGQVEAGTSTGYLKITSKLRSEIILLRVGTDVYSALGNRICRIVLRQMQTAGIPSML